MTFKELFKKVDEMNEMLASANYKERFNVYMSFDNYKYYTFTSLEELKAYVNYAYIAVISKQILKQDVAIGQNYEVCREDDFGQYMTVFTVTIAHTIEQMEGEE